MQRAWRRVCELVVVMLLGASVAPAAAPDPAGAPAAGEPAKTQASPAGELYPPERIMTEFGKAVVLIRVVTKEGKEFLGTGFVADPEGRIITNYHVVQGAKSGTVRLANGDVYDDISIINYDARKDLVVLKIKGFKLPTVRLGDSETAVVGQKVTVIGHPEGLTNTISDGLVSAIRPDEEHGCRLLQVTAPISPGSSGGPIFSDRGEVIAVVCSLMEEGQNLNFAIPINYARGMLAGPVRCLLENLPRERVAGGAAGGAQSLKEDMEQLVGALREALTASDLAQLGGGSYCADVGRAAYVDPNVTQGAERLARAARELDRLKETSGPVGDFARTCLEHVVRAGEAEDSVVDILLVPYTNTSVAWMNRHWTTFHAAIGDLRALGPKLRDLCREQAPELLKTLPPAFQEYSPRASGEGFLGVSLPEATDTTCLLSVSSKSPADRAGFRSGDVVLGVVGSVSFANGSELWQYIRRHAGLKVRFRVQRGDKEIILTATPEAYKP